VELPLKLLIQSIDDYCIINFKDTAHNPEAPPHNYIVLPLDGAEDIVICVITSQMDSLLNYYQKTKKGERALQCLVHVDYRILEFLRHDKTSLIECNKAELISKEELKHRVDQRYSFDFPKRGLPKELVERIRRAIRESPIVRGNVKAAIDRLIPYKTD
jgi:hypothetical protein